MTKQGEIREGIAFRLYELDGGNQGCWNTDIKVRKEYWHRALLISQYLHSQGVAIKVERELPKLEIRASEQAFELLKEHEDCCRMFSQLMADNMLKAGYTAWEPLIDNELKDNGHIQAKQSSLQESIQKSLK